jgi:choline kinase
MRFIISAAGLGARLGMNMPKCLLPIHEARLIDYLLALLPSHADVRIVVGFMEADVIAHVNQRWPDVTFVRNPAFATTSNTQSLALAMATFDGPCIIIDGDLIIEPAYFSKFLAYCATGPKTTVGVVRKTSQEAVGAIVENDLVTQFLRPGAIGQDDCLFEWCGIAYIDGVSLRPIPSYVFEELALYLPLPAFEFVCHEIDTPRDLDVTMQALVRGDISLAEIPLPARNSQKFGYDETLV